MNTSENVSAATDLAKRVSKLERSRRGKKGSITKRIDEIRRLMGETGSRAKIVSSLSFVRCKKCHCDGA